jgi:hypothetical protein
MREQRFRSVNSVLKVEEHARCILISWGEGSLDEIVNNLVPRVHRHFGNRRYIVYGRKGWVRALAPLGYIYRGHVKDGKFGHALVREPLQDAYKASNVDWPS